MHEYVGNIHMHTHHSDGTGSHEEIANAAVAAGLDFVVVTDHNVWVDGVERYYETEHGRVLLLVGEEVHDVKRVPQGNHCLVLGAGRQMSGHAAEPQTLIDEVSAAGGYTFLAHPNDPAAPAIGESQYTWDDWEIDGFTGLEIWNYMSNFKKNLGSKWDAVRAVWRPERWIDGPEPATLAKWDELLAAGKRPVAVGGCDGHAFHKSAGPFTITVFPYEDMFRAVNTHILLEEPLSGDFDADKRAVLSAVAAGCSWIGYDLPHPTRGFRFSGQGRNRAEIGGEVRLDAGATFQIVAPAKADIQLVCDGRVVASAENHVSLTHMPVEPGAYRAACYIPFLGKQRGWIFSNPIYLVE